MKAPISEIAKARMRSPRVEERKGRTSKLKFDNSKVDLSGVDDRRNWFNPEHRTPVGAGIGAYLDNTTGLGLYKKLVRKLAEKARDA